MHALMYGFGAIMCVIMATYRYTLLKLSKLFEEEKAIERNLGKVSSQRAHLISIWHYIPRLFVGSVGWICNDFDFYGNKLQQNVFLAALFPGATPYLQQQWIASTLSSHC
ncbi:hypothetical protein CEUSTIGMA_g3624.t1 [Chlamydomonas eustigma]|uniref:Uncharacterized protein n=1 Tax=Chlamydomonas eustigma TaxID=1157962 RepID=A0A250X094_9CHLO|nr:hypothetical protein CEUSTIGMA_g3624.t1 [Chlamydomonas eustigma]|eukprot:GAX76180.1 hypothetical protein CEUSTIGMA_g3624.t1 [Chlamydomonas eustigma]